MPRDQTVQDQHWKSAGTGPGRSDPRDARVQETDATLTCSVQQVVDMDQNEVRMKKEKRGSGGGKGSRTQHLRKKTPSSEKSKPQLLRSWFFSEKHVIPFFSLKQRNF